MKAKGAPLSLLGYARGTENRLALLNSCSCGAPARQAPYRDTSPDLPSTDQIRVFTCWGTEYSHLELGLGSNIYGGLPDRQCI